MKFHGMKCLLSLTALVAVMATQISVAEEAVDPALRIYSRTDAVKGKLTLIGSNTMSQVGAVWGSSFQRLYPDVEIDIQVKGSANAVGSVIDGSADIGLLSRSIHEDEVRAFHGKFGYVPTILTPVLEPQAIYVHKDNPIKSLSLSQLDAIFSKSLKRGAAKTAMTWGDVGVTGKWASAPSRLTDANRQRDRRSFSSRQSSVEENFERTWFRTKPTSISSIRLARINGELGSPARRLTIQRSKPFPLPGEMGIRLLQSTARPTH